MTTVKMAVFSCVLYTGPCCSVTIKSALLARKFKLFRPSPKTINNN